MKTAHVSDDVQTDDEHALTEIRFVQVPNLVDDRRLVCFIINALYSTSCSRKSVMYWFNKYILGCGGLIIADRQG